MNLDNIDDLFKDEFEDFDAKPSNNMWNHINESLNDQDFEAVFKSELSDMETAPPAENWDKIKEHLPISLLLRRHLERLVKVAAILVAGMIGILYFAEQPNDNQIVQVPTTEVRTEEVVDVISSVDALVEEVEKDFVFNIEKPAKKKRKKNKKKVDKSDEEIDNMLQFILEDDEELATNIDQKKIDAALAPSEPLEENNLAVLTDAGREEFDVENMDFKIKIPLKFVEDGEIEAMLNVYDNRHKK